MFFIGLFFGSKPENTGTTLAYRLLPSIPYLLAQRPEINILFAEVRPI